MRRFLVRSAYLLAILSPLALPSRPAVAAALPAGFEESVVTADLSAPTSMAQAPDGRIFVTEQGGRLRVVDHGALLATPFVSLPVDDDGERGLLGVALDPDFAHDGYVYVYYTAKTPVTHNRVSRLTANGNVAVSGSETVLFDLDPLSSATNHNGGALHFGPDGNLYIGAGENADPPHAQSLGTVLGKILRIRPDGGIPSDNPFLATTSGKNRAIWALGLRNPFTFAFSTAGRMFINDVGQDAWEEIDDGIAGSNYGWPDTEGPTNDPRYRSPLFAYSHANGCAITGGAFYDPRQPKFPAAYVGKYFFSDLCGGWIHRFDPATKSVAAFATGIDSPVDLLVDPAGNLYYLAYGSGSLVRVSATTPPPPPASGGLGLLGSYYDGIALSGPARTRLDKQVAFDWGLGQALPGLDGETFSVRWTGQILAKATGVHTFTANSDDGVRLFIGNRKVIDNWTDHSPAESSGAVSLVAGQFYDIRLEYYEDFGTAVIQLFWQGPGFGRQIVPQKNLYPYALLLSGEPPATPADAAIVARLRQDGFAPVVERGATASANDTRGKALLLVSASADPATVRARFRASATPAVVWENALYDDFGLTGAVAGTDFGTVPATTDLRIAKPGHPLAAGFTGVVPVVASPLALSFGEPGASALIVARQSTAPAHPLLFAYERGAAMPVGAAPARRVGLFLGDTTATALTPAGWSLFDAAVRWAVGR